MTNSILIVDDDQNFLSSFRYILEKNGYNVRCCQTGKDALKQLQQHYFDAALIDLHLPDAN